MKDPAWHVAVMVETSRHYGREVTRGISAYFAQHGKWHIYQQERRNSDRMPRWFQKWRGDGVLFDTLVPSVIGRILQSGLPTVAVAELPEHALRKGESVPMFGIDPAAVANMAADFLLRLGFRHFAFCGFAGIPFSMCRERAFCCRIQKAGYACERFQLRPDVHGWDDFFLSGTATGKPDLFADFLRQLPTHTAIFACNDDVARQVVHTCRENDLKIPGDLALLGVDNDPLICEMLRPEITSIEVDAYGAGYAAARELHRILRGGTACHAQHFLPPMRIVERTSSDVMPSQDPMVQTAVRLMQQRATTGLTVKTLVNELHVSRTTLEDHFRRELHQTIHEVLMERRLNAARRLLETTTLPQTAVATQSGFLDVCHFNRCFRQHCQLTPGQYRQRHGARP
jgi:LacI family transcriptional regulator